MVVFARRHGRSRRSRVWGPPVTEPVSVVVPAYNEKEGIESAVRSLVASRHEVEVVVVDDGSTDGTGEIVEALGLPQVRVVRQENAGKPAAINHGVRIARNEIVVLVDGDTRFEPGTVGHPGAAVRGLRGRRGVGQREGRQPARAARAVAAHRVRDGLQPRPAALRRAAVHADGAGRDRGVPSPGPARRQRRQRRHPRRGHGRHRSRRPGRLEGRVRAGCPRVDRGAGDLGAAVEAALPVVLRDPAGDVEAPASGARPRAEREVRAAWPRRHGPVPGAPAVGGTGHGRVPAVRAVLPRCLRRHWCCGADSSRLSC